MRNSSTMRMETKSPDDPLPHHPEKKYSLNESGFLPDSLHLSFPIYAKTAFDRKNANYLGALWRFYIDEPVNP